MKRESVMLAQNWDGKSVVGWMMSEKLDGHRAWWDGGVTRGMVCTDVPWANIDKNRKVMFATGLWSRKAKPIYAPGWFLSALPSGVPLDGELYIGRGQVQRLASTIKKHVPVDSEWRFVRYCVFESPHWSTITSIEGLAWGTRPGKVVPALAGEIKTFAESRPQFDSGIASYVEQSEITSMSEVQDRLDEVVSLGGEGLMLRDPHSVWAPVRSWNLLKVKKPLVGEGVVVGYNWAREGKLAGLMGCLNVSFEGKLLSLSGFTDAEREVAGGVWVAGGRGDGRVVAFGIGDRVKFTYRELTNDGIPKEARYLRC